MIYEASFSFFIENDDRDRFEKILSELLEIDPIDDLDHYDDGEDFCIDCIANIEIDDNTPTNKIVDTISGKINDWMTDWYAAWDFHYVSGNGFKWEP